MYYIHINTYVRMYFCVAVSAYELSTEVKCNNWEEVGSK